MADVPGKSYSIDHRAVAYLLGGKLPISDITPIYPELRRRAEIVRSRALVLVGKRTGRLAASIRVEEFKLPTGWTFRISANTRYAYYHHQGTKPHIIKGPVSFRSGGRIVVLKNVAHPGTLPNPYLERALPAFMAARDIL